MYYGTREREWDIYNTLPFIRFKEGLTWFDGKGDYCRNQTLKYNKNV